MAHSIVHPTVKQHIAPTEWLKNIYKELQLNYRNAVTRKQLRDLPEYLLADIGIDKNAAEKEVNRSPLTGALFFWV